MTAVNGVSYSPGLGNKIQKNSGITNEKHTYFVDLLTGK